MKLLGLESLAYELNTLKNEVLVLTAENEELKKNYLDCCVRLGELETQIEEIEIPEFDADDFVREDDVNDRIESYLNDNDYVTQSYCDDEIETKVSDAIDDADIDSKIESAIEDLDIDEKVRDLFNDASPAPMSEDDIKKEVAEAVKVTLERMVKALADQQN
jgi:hypothetical protein